MKTIFAIGCGNCLRLHLDGIKNKDYHIKYIYDIDIKKSSKFIVDNNLKDIQLIYHFPDDLTCDIAIIATPHKYHFSYIKKLFDMNIKYIICEKPLYLNKEEKNEIIELQNKNLNKKLIPVFQNRFLIKDNMLINNIKRIDYKLNICRPNDYYQNNWRGKEVHKDSVIMNQAIHYLDLIFNICNIRELPNIIDNVIYDIRKDLEVPDFIKSSLDFKDVQINLFLSTRANSNSQVNYVEIYTKDNKYYKIDFLNDFKDIPNNIYSNYMGSKRMHHMIYNTLEKHPYSLDSYFLVTDFCIRIHDYCMKDLEIKENYKGEII